MKISTRDKLKSFITLNGVYIKKLAQMMSEKSSQLYTEDSLSGKIRRETIKFKEVELMADVLGYRIEFIKK